MKAPLITGFTCQNGSTNATGRHGPLRRFIEVAAAGLDIGCNESGAARISHCVAALDSKLPCDRGGNTFWQHTTLSLSAATGWSIARI